jgi:dTDP-4-dehydrorhamnose 3,5-epimerase
VRIIQAAIPDVLVIEPDVHRDSRGFFVETYHAERYRAHGIDVTFVQDNYSRSLGGTLRGLHLQARRPQAKLIRVTSGAIFDVAVDVRRGSPTFAKWVAVQITADNFRQCFVPAGFAHGFLVLSPEADVEYKCSAVYDPESEVGIAWNDPTIGIEWPIDNPVLSDRDRTLPLLAAQLDRLPVFSAHVGRTF